MIPQLTIPYGTRTIARKLGYAADFCAICRRIRPWLVKELRRYRHVFFVPFGRGEVTAQQRTCTDCGQHDLLVPNAYRAFVRDAKVDIDTLVHKTNPHLLEELTDRLILEERMRQSPDQLTRDERMGLLTEPFIVLGEQVEQETGRGAPVRPGAAILGILTVAMLFVLIAAMALAERHDREVPPLVVGAAAAFAGVSAVTLSVLATQSRRYMKRRILPLLVRALAPLQPSLAELAEVLGALKANDEKIGRKLRPEWIIEAIGLSGTMAAHDRLAPRSDPLARP
jgi:hypothetical protein